jgi:hypothetical protein
MLIALSGHLPGSGFNGAGVIERRESAITCRIQRAERRCDVLTHHAPAPAATASPAIHRRNLRRLCFTRLNCGARPACQADGIARMPFSL